jgi:hypothetical protein
MRSSMIGLLAFGVAVAIQGCGGATTDSGGAGTSGGGTGSGGKQGVGGSSGSKSTGGAPGVGGTTGSVGGSGGDPGSGGVPPTGGAGGVPGVGGVGGGGTCAPPSCAGCPDCFSACFCQTSAAEECKLACSGGTGGVSGAGGAPASCDEITREVYARLDAAKSCCPACDSIQCTGSVPGPCCPETVGNANSGETLSYLEALKRLQGSNCGVACPAIPCGPAEPSHNCVPGPAGNGRCQ